MAGASDAGSTRSGVAEAFELAGKSRRGDFVEGHEPPARDLKKLILIAGLGTLSWVATYIGMLELIQSNMGELPLVHKSIIAFSVAMLMVMIIWLLDQMFAPIPSFTKVCYAIGYVFLTIISVGFGFGFYWKVLESRSEASRSAELAVAQVQGSLHAAATRLDQLDGTLVKLSEVSTEKAELERTKGTSCPNSRPGDGPRRKMREEDAARFSFASDFVKGRATAVKGELTALDAELVKIAGNDPSTFDPKTGTRNEFMKALSRKLDMTVTGFNAFRTDPQLRQLRTELADRAEQSTFGDPKKGGFICPDAQLQGALRGAVKAIDQLPVLEKPKVAAVEGSEATLEAFRRLTATFFGALSFKMPPSADELRELQQKAVQSVESGTGPRFVDPEMVGLSKRDYVPLSVALFVDLCLLLVSMSRPVNRLGGLLPRMREAERSPVSQILSRFNDIHRDPDIRQTFEVFRHVVFDQGGVYYVAVPLDAPYHMGPRQAGQRFGYGSEEAQELQHEAHLLANLFTSFEKERIFARVYSPLLSTRMIQRKLARQGSKFAGCEAFRVYRFRDGAWPEIILGAVMGAARRAEQQEARAVSDAAATVVAAPSAPVVQRREPSLSAIRGGRDPSRPVAPGQATASRQWPKEPVSGDRQSAGASEIDPQIAAGYGPYARAAMADLASGPEAEIEVKAANSNTMPAQSGGQPAKEPRQEASSPATAGDDGSPTVVPLPVRPRPQVQSQISDPVDPIVPAMERSGPPEGMVDVVMRRETATFRVPVSQATLPISLLSGGEDPQVAGISVPPHATGALPATTQPQTELNEPVSQIARALDAPRENLTEDPLNVDFFEIEDPDLEDVTRLAGRLRPTLPGS